jgi:hypothetical protein
MFSCGSCASGESCESGSCVCTTTIPDCSTIACGLSVTVCGKTIVSCQPGCAG